jgi:transposase-like protein
MARTKGAPKARMRHRYSQKFRQEAVQMVLDGHSDSQGMKATMISTPARPSSVLAPRPGSPCFVA